MPCGRSWDQDKSIGFVRPDVLPASVYNPRAHETLLSSFRLSNEVDNVGPLAREIQAALVNHQPFEIIFVDDGSTDGTVAAVKAAHAGGIPEIRLLEHSQRCGQSRAVCTGVEAARAEWVATLTATVRTTRPTFPNCSKPSPPTRLMPLPSPAGHGQSHHKKRYVVAPVFFTCGESMYAADCFVTAPRTRAAASSSMHRATFMRLPWFNHMYRFLPALYQRAGARVVSVPVRHRPRTRGVSKYGLSNRLWVGIVDLFGVRWLILRNSPPIRIRESLPHE